MGKIKKSYGIICCKKDPKYGLQIVLVKKPTTYHFCEFIAGHYRKGDEAHLKKLFNNMTYYEKMDILSMRFSVMWYRINKSNPELLSNTNSFQSRQYMRKKTKFENSFMHDGGDRLKKLMADTVNSETLWEIPKGRKNEEKGEECLNAAIREFTEETGISEDKYKILCRIPPYIETYSDFGVTYQNTFYYADMVGDWVPTIKFSDGFQIAEVSAIRWCSLTDIINMNLERSTYSRLVNMFKKVAKRYKNSR